MIYSYESFFHKWLFHSFIRTICSLMIRSYESFANEQTSSEGTCHIRSNYTFGCTDYRHLSAIISHLTSDSFSFCFDVPQITFQWVTESLNHWKKVEFKYSIEKLWFTISEEVRFNLRSQALLNTRLQLRSYRILCYFFEVRLLLDSFRS